MLYPAMLAVAWAGPSTTEPSGPMRIVVHGCLTERHAVAQHRSDHDALDATGDVAVAELPQRIAGR